MGYMWWELGTDWHQCMNNQWTTSPWNWCGVVVCKSYWIPACNTDNFMKPSSGDAVCHGYRLLTCHFESLQALITKLTWQHYKLTSYLEDSHVLVICVHSIKLHGCFFPGMDRNSLWFVNWFITNLLDELSITYNITVCMWTLLSSYATGILYS